MNKAVALLREMFRFDDQTGDVFETGPGEERPMAEYFAPNVCHSLFGASGDKELLVGREAFLAFVQGCADALADRRDEVLSINAIGEECAIVHARAWRKSKATGEEIEYDWAMLYRVEDGRIAHGADMLDSDAQAFWGRISG